jgi:hypothetical protein
MEQIGLHNALKCKKAPHKKRFFQYDFETILTEIGFEAF